MWIVLTIIAIVAAAAWLANDFRALWVPAGLAVLGAVLGVPHAFRLGDPSAL